MKITKRKIQIKRLPTKMQTFDLTNPEESEYYYALLEYLTGKNIELPILSKGSMRIIDMGVGKAKKIDKELRAIMHSHLPLKEQFSLAH